METWITILTLAIILFFAVVSFFLIRKDYNKRNISNYTTNLIFVKYNKKIEKIDKFFENEKLSQILAKCKLQVSEDGENEEQIYLNIRTLDAIEDNLALLDRIKKEAKHQGEVQDKISLMKRDIKLYDMSGFVATSKATKFLALMAFCDKFREVPMTDGMKKLLSSTPCYYFGKNFIFLSKQALVVDLENAFAVEYVDYKNIGVKVWQNGEEYVDFDGTFDLSNATSKYPDGADENDADVKIQVLQKNYVLSFTYNDLTFDVLKSEVQKDKQESLEKFVDKTL